MMVAKLMRTGNLRSNPFHSQLIKVEEPLALDRRSQCLLNVAARQRLVDGPSLSLSQSHYLLMKREAAVVHHLV